MPRGAARWPIGMLWLAVALGLWILVLRPAGLDPVAWWPPHVQLTVARADPHDRTPIVSIRTAPPTPDGTGSSVSKAPLTLHLTATRLGRNSLEGYADIGVNASLTQTYKAGPFWPTARGYQKSMPTPWCLNATERDRAYIWTAAGWQRPTRPLFPPLPWLGAQRRFRRRGPTVTRR